MKQVQYFLLSIIFIILILVFLNLFINQNKLEYSSDNSLGKIVSYFKNNNYPTKETNIILTGDVMLGRSVMTKSFSENNFSYPFLKVKEELNNADLVFVNLEAPFYAPCPKVNSGMQFCADPLMVKGLVDSNINIVNLANNHILNYGLKGLEKTKTVLTENNISFTGVNNLVIKEINNIRFGFLGFNFLDQKLKDSDLKLVSDSKNKVDVLIVSVHWGEEYKDKANTTQKQIAKALVNSGSDVIVGHHPHWVEEIERIDNTPVYYSLGNFVFDQMWSEKTKQGLVIKLTFKGNKLINEEQLAVYIQQIGQPQFVQ